MENMSGSNPNEFISQERAAIVVHRGWIPYEMKSKKSRPWETNSNQLVRVEGVFRRSKDVHDYKYPNNPSNNEWYNLATEDIARFWELPNSNELKFFYFQAVDIHNRGGSTVNNGETVYKWPHVLTNDELIRDYHDFWTTERFNRMMFYSFGSISATSMLFYFLTIG